MAATALAPSRTVNMNWQRVNGARGYDIEFTPADKDPKDLSSKINIKGHKSNSIDVKLAPGIYTMKIRALDERLIPGPWSPGVNLSVPFPAIKPESPPPNSRIEVKDPLKTKISFSWNGFSEAQIYEIEILNSKNELIAKKETAEKTIALELPVNAQYSWRVRALLNDKTPGLEAPLQSLSIVYIAPPKPKPVKITPRKSLKELNEASDSTARSIFSELRYAHATNSDKFIGDNQIITINAGHKFLFAGFELQPKSEKSVNGQPYFIDWQKISLNTSARFNAPVSSNLDLLTGIGLWSLDAVLATQDPSGAFGPTPLKFANKPFLQLGAGIEKSWGGRGIGFFGALDATQGIFTSDKSDQIMTYKFGSDVRFATYNLKQMSLSFSLFAYYINVNLNIESQASKVAYGQIFAGFGLNLSL